MTASDFHKKLRDFTLSHPKENAQWQISAAARQFHISEQDLQVHLQTLTTLGLVRYHNEEQTTFSLTESGKLANLP